MQFRSDDNKEEVNDELKNVYQQMTGMQVYQHDSLILIIQIIKTKNSQ